MYLESKELSGASYRDATGGDPKDLSKVLIGALAGAVAGSIIAALFTEKGIEARQRVSEGSKNIANNLKDKVSDITEGIADKYEAAKESAANLIEKGKQKVGISPDNPAYNDTANADANGTGSKILLGALAVSVAGSIVWSFVSEKGIETRKRLGKGSKDIANNLKENFSNIADGIADTYEAAKEGAVDLIEKGKQQADMSSGSVAYKGSTGTEAW